MQDKDDVESVQYRKMADTPVARLITTLAIPAVISMLVTSIYNTADTYFVSKLGTSASGAVGIVFALMAVYQAVGFMCGQGAGSFVSRLLGKKEPERAKVFANSAFLLSFLLGLGISIFGFLFLEPLLRLLGSTQTILPYARQYVVWILAEGPLLSSSCTLNSLRHVDPGSPRGDPFCLCRPRHRLVSQRSPGHRDRHGSPSLAVRIYRLSDHVCCREYAFPEHWQGQAGLFPGFPADRHLLHPAYPDPAPAPGRDGDRDSPAGCRYLIRPRIYNVCREVSADSGGRCRMIRFRESSSRIDIL